MNIDALIDQYKCKKIGNPASAVQIADLDQSIFNNVKNSIINQYNLEDNKYATNEAVFFGTRRIVAKSKFIKTSKQLYTETDFDYQLIDTIGPIIDQVKIYLGNSEPTLIQIATLLPGQQLSWHVDTFLYQQFSNKIHIPLFTNGDAYYDVLFNGSVKRTNMTEGKIWNINNLDLHRSINLGLSARSHLIMDFINSDVLKVLEKIGINYFHHRLDFMSSREKCQLAELVEFNKIRNQQSLRGS